MVAQSLVDIDYRVGRIFRALLAASCDNRALRLTYTSNLLRPGHTFVTLVQTYIVRLTLEEILNICDVHSAFDRLIPISFIFVFIVLVIYVCLLFIEETTFNMFKNVVTRFCLCIRCRRENGNSE